jgi:hypothetical protein
MTIFPRIDAWNVLQLMATGLTEKVQSGIFHQLEFPCACRAERNEHCQ